MVRDEFFKSERVMVGVEKQYKDNKNKGHGAAIGKGSGNDYGKGKKKEIWRGDLECKQSNICFMHDRNNIMPCTRDDRKFNLFVSFFLFIFASVELYWTYGLSSRSCFEGRLEMYPFNDPPPSFEK